VASFQPVPIAVWNSARGVWEKLDVNMICGHQALFWETFPTSGTMRSGRLFPLRTWARRTHAPGSSSLPLLGTPRSGHGMNETMSVTEARLARGTRPRSTLEESVALLPTPNAGNFNDGEDLDSWEARKQANLEKYGNGNGMGTPLSMAVKMLPTPNASRHTSRGGDRKDERLLGGIVQDLALLPTPTSADRKGSSAPVGRSRPDGREYTMGDARLADVAGLLPTPTASLQEPAPWKEGVDWWLQSRATRNLEGVVSGNTPMMPTPQSRDWKGAPGAGSRERGGHQGDLSSALGELPEPETRQAKTTKTPQRRGRGEMLGQATLMEED